MCGSDVVGPVIWDPDPHAFWKREFDPVALTAPPANAWLRFWQMIAWIEGSLVSCGNSIAFDAKGKRRLASHGSAFIREVTD